MKIGVDTFACDGGRSGVGTYLLQLLRRIPPSGARFELFGWEFDRFTFREYAPDLEYISRCRVMGKSANAMWHLHRYPKFAKDRSYNACFFPAAHKQPPFSSPCPTIGVIHDLAAYWGTRRTREHLGAILRPIMSQSLRRIDRIIAVSEWIKQELVERVKVKEHRIEVVPNGVDLTAFYPRPHGDDESELLIQPFSFRRPYILCVSRIDHPVKNHIGLIKAFGIFKERTGSPHRLVLAGSDSHDAATVKAEAAASAWRTDIFFTGHFPLKSLPDLYSGADFAVLPSMHEGFGMSVIEAMAMGIPVACARAASLPETAGHAALYFDPKDPEDMADRMVALASDQELRQECRRIGIERAQAFTWDQCAKRTLEIIMETAG